MPARVIDELRSHLREKFPRACGMQPVLMDDPAPGPGLEPAAFPPGAVSEVVGSGIGLLVAGLLAEPEGIPPLPEFVLIDGSDSFDPESFTAGVCSRLLWVRCQGIRQLLGAADLAVRDGNLPFVLLDTCGIPPRELRAMPASSWWRLKLAAEATNCRVVVMTAAPLVPCAAVRFSLTARLTLADFSRPRGELVSRLRVVRERLRHAK